MLVHFFFFKQKTAYEIRISDWSSDVCSSDLRQHAGRVQPPAVQENHAALGWNGLALFAELELELHAAVAARDRVRHVAGTRRDRTVGEEGAIGRAEGRRFDADHRFHCFDRLGVQGRRSEEPTSAPQSL